MKPDSAKRKTPNQGPVRGIISITSKGTGYVSVEGCDEDILIEAENLNTALNKDEVEVKVLPSVSRAPSRSPRATGRGNQPTGIVLKILRRAKTNFVGVLQKDGARWVLAPDDWRFYTKILITNPSEKTREGLKALATITRFDDPKKYPEGTLLKIIGEKGLHDVEMQSIVLEKGFATEFPPEVEREAEAVEKRETPIPAAEITKRRDFRNTLTFTIDPVDAKDFDDAISFRKLPNGNFEIGVHIADVSHYVREGTALDGEGRARGFSVYLVDRTIPMLPEALSNDLCSLKPNEDKLTFSAVFEIDARARIVSQWFGKTIIHSVKRFTYEAAQKILDEKYGEHAEELKTLNSLAEIMRAEKFKKGAIDFEQDEIRFELDATGVPIRIFKKERLATHKLVEEFMLLANKEVAEFMEKKRTGAGKAKPFIYRIHDVPDAERIAALGIFVKALGHDLPIKQGVVKAKDLQALFKKIEGHAEEGLIKTAAVRSMAKAVYSTKNIGHFGLAFSSYTHFTSPIRRYADLLVHRILFKELSGVPIPDTEWQSYQKIADENSEQEIAAADAERTSKKYKQVEYMEKMIGKEFDGLISGVTEWGMYVEEKETRCEGMVKLRDLGGDFFVLDQKNYAIVGTRTKKKFTLGDTVRFRVIGADRERKTLDYKLVSS